MGSGYNGRMVFNSKHKPVAELFGLPEPPKTGLARLIHVAIELFYGHGFQAVIWRMRRVPKIPKRLLIVTPRWSRERWSCVKCMVATMRPG